MISIEDWPLTKAASLYTVGDKKGAIFFFMTLRPKLVDFNAVLIVRCRNE